MPEGRENKTPCSFQIDTNHIVLSTKLNQTRWTDWKKPRRLQDDSLLLLLSSSDTKQNPLIRLTLQGQDKPLCGPTPSANAASIRLTHFAQTRINTQDKYNLYDNTLEVVWLHSSNRPVLHTWGELAVEAKTGLKRKRLKSNFFFFFFTFTEVPQQQIWNNRRAHKFETPPLAPRDHPSASQQCDVLTQAKFCKPC